jgi:Ca-activated chloride channel family protein
MNDFKLLLRLLILAAAALLFACTSREPATPEPGTPPQDSSVEPTGKMTTPTIGQENGAVLHSSQGLREERVRERRDAQFDQPTPATLMAGRSIAAPCCPQPPYFPTEPLDRENYQQIDTNPLRLVSEYPVSTFSVDVDTGAYSNLRRILNEGRLPPADAVRIEELINYFDYAYSRPDDPAQPFSVNTEIAAAPWNPDRLLLQVGIRGYEVPAAERKAANLVFLVDVSGSMQTANKLPLLKRAMRLLTRQLNAGDRVSLVVYAGAAGVVLEPTPGDQHAKIEAALERLAAGGSTNGAGGIRAAYAMARQAYVDGGINRILIATDGDFNVGTVDFDQLIDLVEREREAGVSLTTLGFGAGNYNDKLMEQLADSGNGNHAYIDSLNEARKVLVEQLSGTLQTIAKDVKIQVEFNSAIVAEYRLIGYENRMLRREDFNNDKIDAGEIGAGHTVTALYELTLVDSDARLVDPLRYGEPEPPAAARLGEAAFVRLRYKQPDGDRSRLIERPVAWPADDPASDELRFAAAVAAFGQLLRGGQYLGDYGYGDVLKLAGGARGEDSLGYRGEFLGLVRLADSLSVVAPAPQARR